MAQDIEIVVEDPTAPDENSPAVTSTRTVELVVMTLLLALAVLLGWDNWRTGASWDDTGPQAGYFPFYLSIILGGAALFGFVSVAVKRTEGRKPSLRARSLAACCRCSCRRCCSASRCSGSAFTWRASC
jgi:hypothetical protein